MVYEYIANFKSADVLMTSEKDFDRNASSECCSDYSPVVKHLVLLEDEQSFKLRIRCSYLLDVCRVCTCVWLCKEEEVRSGQRLKMREEITGAVK